MQMRRRVFRGAAFITRAVGNPTAHAAPCPESHAALFPINCEFKLPEVEREKEREREREREAV